MRMLSRSMTVTLLTILSILLAQQPAAATSSSLGLFPPLTGIAVGDTVGVDLTVATLVSESTFDVTMLLSTNNTSALPVVTQLLPGGSKTISASIALGSADIAECTANGSLFLVVLVLWDDINTGSTPKEVLFTSTQPCTVQAEPTSVTPLPPTQTEVCGPNNDIIVTPPQPAGVEVLSDIGWTDGLFLVKFFAYEGYAFPPGTKTNYSFTDANTACPTEPSSPTPSPTVEPSPTPTVTATTAPSPTSSPTLPPTAPPVVTPGPTAVAPPAVTGLPKTGSGDSTGTGLVMASLLIVAMGAVAIVAWRERAR